MRPDSTRPQRPGDAPAPHKAARHHVLLVEDDPTDARLTQAHLAQLDRFPHEVSVARTLQSALAALQGKAIDVVLLDLNLPDSRGIDTVATVLRAHRDVPVVVLTGQDDEDLALAAARLGAQDYVVKGRTKGVLQHVLTYAIERHAILNSRTGVLSGFRP